MFCFQCEQTAGGKACTGKAGVCGKPASNAVLQDKLTGALIGLSRAAQKAEPTTSTNRMMIEGLFTTITNVNFDNDSVQLLTDAIHREKEELVNNTAESTNASDFKDYDMEQLWEGR